jgi:LPXTG-motif cell wall-anchored protein
VILTDQVAPGCEQDLGTLDPGESVRVACQSDEQLIQHTRNVAVATGTPVDQSGNPIIDAGTGEPIDVPPVSDDAVAEPQHHDTDNPDDPHGHGGHHHDGNEPGDGDGSGGGGTSPTPDTSSGWLPNTGAAAGMPMLIAMGLLALLIGSVLLIRERRRNIR